MTVQTLDASRLTDERSIRRLKAAMIALRGALDAVIGSGLLLPFRACISRRDEIAPCAGPDHGAELDTFVRRTGVSVDPPASTRRMDAEGDANRAVDVELRGCGLAGFRVVDASAMPDLVGGNIDAVIMRIAEKAADMLLGRPPLPKA